MNIVPKILNTDTQYLPNFPNICPAALWRLSAEQSLFFVHRKLFPRSSCYNLGVMVDVLGGAAGADWPRRLPGAILRMLERRPMFRCTFADGPGGEGLSRIASMAEARTWLGEGALPELAPAGVAAFQARPLDLAAGPPVRFAVVRLPPEGHRGPEEREMFRGIEAASALLIVAHHIVCDARSLALAAADIGAALREPGTTAAGAASAAAAEADLGFLLYVQQQRAVRADAEAARRRLAYWAELLTRGRGGAPFAPLLLAPEPGGERGAAALAGRRSGAAWFSVPAEVVGALARRCAPFTLFNVVLVAWALTLSELAGGERDLTLGVACDLRMTQQAATPDQAGSFSSTMPVRCQLGECRTFLEAVRAAAQVSDRAWGTGGRSEWRSRLALSHIVNRAGPLRLSPSPRCCRQYHVSSSALAGVFAGRPPAPRWRSPQFRYWT